MTALKPRWMILSPPGMSDRQPDRDTTRRLFDSGENSDCKIVCQGREFKVHQQIISACPFFAAALMHDFQEKQSRIISLDDDDVVMVERLLRYLYGFPLPRRRGSTFHVWCDLFVIASKYDVPMLRNGATIVILEQIGSDEVPGILPLEEAVGSLLAVLLHKTSQDFDLLHAVWIFMQEHHRELFSGSLGEQVANGIEKCPGLAMELLKAGMVESENMIRLPKCDGCNKPMESGHCDECFDNEDPDDGEDPQGWSLDT